MSIRRILKNLEKSDPVQAPDLDGYMDHNTIADKKAAVIGARPPFYSYYDSTGKFRGQNETNNKAQRVPYEYETD